MSERETDAGEDAWEPTFPWERAGRWLPRVLTGIGFALAHISETKVMRNKNPFAPVGPHDGA